MLLLARLQSFTIEFSSYSDFVTLIASLDIERQLSIAGAHCSLRTNSVRLACEMATRYPGNAVHPVDPRFVFQLRVEETTEEETFVVPTFHGMEHLVFAAFGSRTFFTFNLLRGEASGVIPSARVNDSDFWQRIIVPITVGVLGPTLGIAPLHCACLVRRNEGILITGMSGAGKSTLSVAMAKCGFNLISDDWTYVTATDGRLSAHGLSAPVKLLPDASQFFPELNSFTPIVSLNGELAYELPLSSVFGVAQKEVCRPRILILLRRTRNAGYSFREMSRYEVQNWLQDSAERLPTRLHVPDAKRRAIFEQVATLQSFTFETALPPREAALILRSFCESR